MAITIAQDRLLQEIAKDNDHKYFDTLYANEQAIDWLGFANDLYTISHSTATICTYCRGICAFRDFCASTKSTDMLSSSLGQTISQVKTTNGLVYKLLRDFVQWLDGEKQYAPRTTRNYYQGIVKLLQYLEVEPDKTKLASIRLPKPADLNDEYPTNAETRMILTAASLTIRGYVQTIIDTGFEPVDAAQLQVKHVRFDEDPARVPKLREKTKRTLEGFLSADTVETLKQIIRSKNKQPDDYLFVERYNNYVTKRLRDSYNLAVARAGFGKVVTSKTTESVKYRGNVDKIDGHRFGKYHLKVYKKRWFSMAIASGVPEYICQAMLGRGAYLAQYNRQPLEKRQEFARKILRTVSPFADKADKKQVITDVAQTLGLENVSEEQLRKVLAIAQGFAKLPADRIDKLKALLSGESD